MDKFLVFSLSLEDQAFVERYRSPKNEASHLKMVPISQLERAKDILRKMGIKPRVKYRGPRYDSMRQTCLKRHAHSAAIYSK